MEQPVNDNLFCAGLDERCQQRFTDIHCHCLAGVDDGPATISQSLALCQGLVDDGITTVIATPHQLGRFNDCNEAEQIREEVSALNEELKNNGRGVGDPAREIR